ncbi:MAG TPA: translocation/assembly module TamB domain-containing protein [Methylibium sp.]|uniref:translocation/assembly module TamB domain-containing protein n=1 Tax=Methylibium sp. TaxID=2067992 RepID=UPI002DBA78E2|nr:translocation/assembly module TamB domain-containing protein [Methylibium sp.]HEU4458186.1 translocation/assembly module TamB domain-containing protein [Methylibium sp.]
MSETPEGRTSLAPPPAAPPRKPRLFGKLTLALLLAPPVAALAAIGALWQGLHTEAGTRWWLARIARHVPAVAIDAPRGALLGRDAKFAADRLVLRLGTATLRIDGLRLDGLHASGWRATSPYARLDAALLAADRIRLETAPDPAPKPPSPPPMSLRTPVALRVDALRIAAFELAALGAPVEQIRARIEVGAEHRLDDFSARWRGLVAQGQARLEADGAMQLEARSTLAADPNAASSLLPPGARELRVEVQASGPLARFDAQAALELQDQRVDAKAQLAPFERAPLSRLDARFDKLDLARLAGALGNAAVLPGTALDGTLQVQLTPEQPLVVQATVRNAEPGRWDRRRLPLAGLDLLARGAGSAWTIERGRLQLAGDGARAAGSVEAAGRIDAARADVELRLRDVLLRALDERAPALRLAGPIKLQHEPPAGASGAGVVRVDAQLEAVQLATPVSRGTAAAKPLLREPLRLALAASADLQAARYTVDKLQARSAGARLDGKGRAERDGAAWQAQAELSLAEFDPAPWLPGDPGAAWKRARNRLAGQLKLDARVPAALPAPPAAARKAAAPPEALRWLAATQGRLDLRFADNLFAGQPLDLNAQAEADGRGNASARLDALAAGNRAKGELVLALAASRTGGERAQLEIDAPALDRLAPLAQAFGLGALAGRLQAQASADGPLGAWLGGTPNAALRTRGDAKAQRIDAAGVTLAAGTARWDLTLPARADLGGTADPKLEARAELRELKSGGLAVPQATLDLAGSLAAHRARLQATLRPGSAPTQAAADAQAAAASRSGVASNADGAEAAKPNGLGPLALALDFEGGWQAQPATEGGLWRGRWNELLLRPAGARSASAATPLVEARGVELEWQQGRSGLRLAVAPAQAEVLGAVLRWSRAEWSRTTAAAGAAPKDRIELDATVEPFRVAPLLQRLQPDFGWGGDLLVAGKARVRSEPALTAAIEIARTGGDLTVQEFDVVQRLGLSALRLDLNVAQGVWAATQVIDGETLGRVAGAQTVRGRGGDGGALLPAADAPVEGAIRLQVDNLSTWGAWVPAGWRLGGALDGVVTIGGRFGAPELTGSLSGRQLAVRNALEGVALADGDLQARFDGETAKLENLSFRAGDGKLEARGDARLGAAPRANLRVNAERATVLGRVDRRVVASGEARLALDAQAIRLEGELRADEGLIDISRGDAPKLGEDVRVRRTAATPGEAGVPAPATAPPAPPRNVDLRLAVALGERFRLRGRGIDTRLEGRLLLTSPKAKLTASGEIRTVDGTYEAYGQSLVIERGVITFVSDIANPRLDIQAVRAKTEVRVGVIVSGSAQSPRVRLFSEPELPSTEKLALLVTGRSYDSLGGAETALLQQAAMALLAGDGGDGQSKFDVARMLQLDELSVRQSDGAVRDTVVTLGKQISDRVYVGYERGLQAAGGNWQLIYRIAQRFTLRAQSGDDPAVDLIWMFRWN